MKHLRKKQWIGFIGFVLVTLSVGAAWAEEDLGWNFSCFPKTTIEVKEHVPPNVFISLDTSYSMNGAKLQLAKGAIVHVVSNNRITPLLPARIAHYGFGHWANEPKYPTDTWCSPTSSQQIIDKVWGLTAAGGTETDKAVRAARAHPCHNSRASNQTSATLLITDGAPYYNSRAAAITETCAHRKTGIKPAPLYVVGLGLDTDEPFNNLQAAAGGTGTCEWGDPCDVLDNSGSYRERWGYWAFYDSQGQEVGREQKCSGSFNVTEQDELIKTIRAISGGVACSFPLLDGNGNPISAQEDPNNEYKNVLITLDAKDPGFDQSLHGRMHYKYNQAKLVPGSDDYEQGWWWEFTDNVARNRIKLGDKACAMLNDPNTRKNYKTVTTQPGCVCQEQEGTDCSDPDWENKGLCPEGTWVCQQGIDVCTPGSGGLSKDYECTVPQTQGHCSDGRYICLPQGGIECKPIRGPMPEICNGYDDNCDGIADNIETAWYQTEFASGHQMLSHSQNGRLKDSLYAKACTVQNACNCGSAARPSCAPHTSDPNCPVPDNGQFNSIENIEAYLERWESTHGECLCIAD